MFEWLKTKSALLRRLKRAEDALGEVADQCETITTQQRRFERHVDLELADLSEKLTRWQNRENARLKRKRPDETEPELELQPAVNALGESAEQVQEKAQKIRMTGRP